MKDKINTIRLIIYLFFVTSSIISFSQIEKVLVLNIKSDINHKVTRYIQLGLEEAKAKNYNLVFVDMNTYGGFVTDADTIVANLLKEKLPVYVYIDNNAGSAGSYIALACDSIFMAPGSVMGASTVVNQQMEVMPEKVQSFMRSKMRTTAETNGRNPKIAEELVGIYLHSDSAFVRVLTNKEALEVGFCEGVYESKTEIYKKYGFEKAQIDTYELGLTDKIISFFLNPAVKSLLILLIFGGLYLEIKTPGIGVFASISFFSALLYFIPDYMHGLLAHWEILVFIIGLALVVLEIFVIPGFGLAGVLGIVFLFSSLLLSMIQNNVFDFDTVKGDHLNTAFQTVGIGFIGSIVLLFLTASLLLKSKAFSKFTVQEIIDTKANTSVETRFSLLQKEGVAYTVLRPSGKVKIDGTIYDATSRGDYINQNEKIIVIEDDKSSLKVKKYGDNV